MNRGVAWYKLKDGLIHEFQDFLDTEIIAAFWPNGAPCRDFTAAENAVERLTHYASADALARLINMFLLNATLWSLDVRQLMS